MEIFLKLLDGLEGLSLHWLIEFKVYFQLVEGVLYGLLAKGSFRCRVNTLLLDELDYIAIKCVQLHISFFLSNLQLALFEDSLDDFLFALSGEVYLQINFRGNIPVRG